MFASLKRHIIFTLFVEMLLDNDNNNDIDNV